MEQKIKELMADQSFVEKLLSCEEPEEVQSLFNENEVYLSIEEIKQIGKALENLEGKDGELTEEDLEAVAGGIAIGIVLGIVGAIASITGGTYTLVTRFDRIKDFFSRW